MDVDHEFAPKYVVPKGKGPVIKELKAAAKAAGVERNLLILTNAMPDLEKIGGCSTMIVEPGRSKTKAPLFGCRMCGQCALPVTGYVCPMGCPKELRNGPCGGVGADGSCEVYPERRCVWVDAYDRAASQGRSADLRLLLRPIDHRRWGQSSWLNYWQGRDEGLWTGDANSGPGAQR